MLSSGLGRSRLRLDLGATIFKATAAAESIARLTVVGGTTGIAGGGGGGSGIVSYPRLMPQSPPCIRPGAGLASIVNSGAAIRHLLSASRWKIAFSLGRRAKHGRGKCPVDWTREYGSAMTGGTSNSSLPPGRARL